MSLSSRISPSPSAYGLTLQQHEQPGPVCIWTSYLPFGPSPSAFPRDCHALSATATSASELFIFGGYAHGSSPSNDLYVFSTQNYSSTFWHTTGNVPSPRVGHSAVLIGKSLLIWGGSANFRNQKPHGPYDNSIYFLNLVSRHWTSVVLNSFGPCGRVLHTSAVVGTKLFVFGGQMGDLIVNDMWVLDLNSQSPFWETYEPLPAREKPLPRAGHVSVINGDSIIIFGGSNVGCFFNDTWSFDISTRKWTELQCTGHVPTPRRGHAASLVNGVMYVFGGYTADETTLDDLVALQLSTQRWFKLQTLSVGPNPRGRSGHTMASDGTRVFILGGISSVGAQVGEITLSHVFDTKYIKYPEPTPITVNIPEEPDRPASLQVTREGLEHDQIAELERLLSETLTVQTEQDRRVAQLTDELALKSTLLERAETNAAEAKRIAELERRENRDRLLVQTSLVKQKDAELGRLQAKLDEFLQSHVQDVRALGQARSALQSRTADSDANAGKYERGKHACEQKFELESVCSRLMDAENGQAKSRDAVIMSLKDQVTLWRNKYEALAKLYTKLRTEHFDILSIGQESQLKAKAAQTTAEAEIGSLQDQVTQWQNKYEVLAKLHDELRTEHSGVLSKSKELELKASAQTTAGVVSMDEERITLRIMERMKSMEAEIASLKSSEKNFEMMECRNEG